MSHLHWVPRGTGTSKDKDEVNRREVYECEDNDVRRKWNLSRSVWKLNLFYSNNR
jgi:hypothetical protein